jgi:hypothetical protein
MVTGSDGPLGHGQQTRYTVRRRHGHWRLTEFRGVVVRGDLAMGNAQSWTLATWPFD